MARLKSKFLGSLVGTAVGDSLGAGGRRYTDDTAMMIGVAESLVGNRGFDAEVNNGSIGPGEMSRHQVFCRYYHENTSRIFLIAFHQAKACGDRPRSRQNCFCPIPL